MTTPTTGFTTIANSTIAVTNTFQTALASSPFRKGALIQNQGTHTMFVFAGPTASATLAQSMQVSAGATFSAVTGSIVIGDNLAITGTSGDAYVVYSQ
jgi:hypothetical protein